MQLSTPGPPLLPRFRLVSTHLPLSPEGSAHAAMIKGGCSVVSEAGSKPQMARGDTAGVGNAGCGARPILTCASRRPLATVFSIRASDAVPLDLNSSLQSPARRRLVLASLAARARARSRAAVITVQPTAIHDTLSWRARPAVCTRSGCGATLQEWARTGECACCACYAFICARGLLPMRPRAPWICTFQEDTQHTSLHLSSWSTYRRVAVVLHIRICTVQQDKRHSSHTPWPLTWWACTCPHRSPGR